MIPLAFCHYLFCALLSMTAIQDQTPEKTVEQLIQAYGLADTREKSNIIEHLDLLDSPQVQEFYIRLLKREKDPKILGQVFLNWALRVENHIILEFINTHQDKAVLREYIPALAKLEKLPRLEILTTLYNNCKFKRFQKEIFETIASLKSKEAFEFLKEIWTDNKDQKLAIELLPAILGMKQSDDFEFIYQLCISRFPFARLEGGRTLLKGYPYYDTLTDILKMEAHPQVRFELLGALAQRKTKKAALAIFETIPSQYEGALHQIVTLLNTMPPQVVLEAAPEDWYYDREPLKFMTLVLTFSAQQYAPLLTKPMLKRIQYGTKDPKPGVRTASVVAFSRIPKNQFKAKRKLSSLVSAGGVETLWEVLDTLQNFRICDEVVMDKILSLFKSKKWEIRIRAAALAGALDLRQALPQLEKCLTHKRLLVRVAGIKALGEMRSKESVDLLLSRLPHEKGRGGWEIIRSLNKITGCNFGKDVKMWKSWWKGFKGKALPPAGKAGLWNPIAAKKDKYAFYGLSLHSKHIVFVLDISSSMIGPSMEKLIKELTRTISGFTRDHRFNMIFFETDVRQWQEGLVSMKRGKEDYKAQALEEVKGLEAGGATNIYDALKAAFEHEDAEAVMFLTDGQATVGPEHESKAILKAVKKWNRTLQLNIHTVAIGGADKDFMQKLAQITNGTYYSYE